MARVGDPVATCIPASAVDVYDDRPVRACVGQHQIEFELTAVVLTKDDALRFASRVEKI